MNAEDGFRSMLLKLTHEIREEELESMKFLCESKLTKRRLERIEETVDLWRALEEADEISKDKTDFLERLLKDGCRNREDLMKIYREWYHKDCRKPESVDTENCEEQIQKEALSNLEKEINLIVQEIGKDWRPLARKLGLSESDIDCIVEQHRFNLREQCREVLKQWVYLQVGKNEKAERIDIVNALLKCEKKSLANQVLNLQ